mmetsp:Transcript_65632/g.140308  ORF Transcript_65632/g.140308 Transcript_65632/m.140308 type:complete len:201 (+) Transcript_65632:1024-1626(+)
MICSGRKAWRSQPMPMKILNFLSKSVKRGTEMMRGTTVRSRCFTMIARICPLICGKCSRRGKASAWQISHVVHKDVAWMLAMRIAAMPSMAISPKMLPVPKLATFRPRSLTPSAISAAAFRPAMSLPSASLATPSLAQASAVPTRRTNIELPSFPSSTMMSPGMYIRVFEISAMALMKSAEVFMKIPEPFNAVKKTSLES